MAAKLAVISSGESDPTEKWTVVVRRRRKNRPNFTRFLISYREQGEQSWEPSDLETDPERESKLVRKISIHLQNFEKSEICSLFLHQLQTPIVLDKIMKVLGSEKKMRMVIYGIGSIEDSESSRSQLSLVLLLKKKFDWIGDIEVFDPIISLTESRILTSLGCSVLSVDEQCRRRVKEPTLFFMPHCEVFAYENLLKANWKLDLLNNVILLGNSFSNYVRDRSAVIGTALGSHMWTATRFTEEVEITHSSGESFKPFFYLSWHFFIPLRSPSYN